jgi:hypothetical protein
MMPEGAAQDRPAMMESEKFDIDTITKERRDSIAKSIRTISVDELKKIGDELFPTAGDPWGELLYQFLGDNPSATFYYAVTSDGVHLVYCRDRDKGLWFKPGSGKGPLQERGRIAMKAAIEKS